MTSGCTNTLVACAHRAREGEAPAELRLAGRLALPTDDVGRNTRKHCRGGFTLIELTVSAAIISIVLLAVGSAIVLSARSLDAASSGSVTQTLQARQIADQVAADLKMAIAFTERTSTAVTFSVPDRNGDGQVEYIRYAWAGPGGAITRQYTSGSNVTVGTLATSAQSFDINWVLRTVGSGTATSGGSQVESAEQVLIFHNGAAGSNIRPFVVSTTAYPGEYFKPTLPNGTVSWKITKLKLMLARNGSAITTLQVQVRGADASQKPVNTATETINISALSLPSTAGYVDVAFNTLSALDPALGYCIVLKAAASPSPAILSWDNAASDSGMSYTSSSDSGANWTTPTVTSAMQYYVYGTYTTSQ